MNKFSRDYEIELLGLVFDIQQLYYLLKSCSNAEELAELYPLADVQRRSFIFTFAGYTV